MNRPVVGRGDGMASRLPITPEILYVGGMTNRPPDACREHLFLFDAAGLSPVQALPRPLRDQRREEDPERGMPAAHVQVEEGDTDTAPYGLGTYASRSTPPAGTAGAMAVRKIRDKAAKIAAHLLEVGDEDLEWEPGQFSVKGAPGKSVTIQDCAFAAYTNLPEGLEPGMEATNYYDPPNLTFPFGTYICVVDIDRGTGEVSVRRFVAVDNCGNIINPMIVQGQIHGGLTQGLGPALYEEIPYDEDGNNLAGSFMDYLVPTAVETPPWETGHTLTPSPHHPLGAKGVGESATVGGAARDRERGGGRVGAPGGDAHGDSDSSGSRVGGAAGEGGGGVRGVNPTSSCRGLDVWELFWLRFPAPLSPADGWGSHR